MSEETYIMAVGTYADMVYRIAFHYCKHKEDAEDILQNTFLKLLKQKKEFDSEEYLKRWLIRVTINECHSLFLSPWKKRQQELQEYGQEVFWDSSEKSDLFYAVMDLPKKYRIVVYLYYYEDYAVREISEIIGVKETTIQTQLMRARKMLREKLEGAGTYGLQKSL